MDITFLLRGLIIGFSIAAPVGPIGILCIRRTLAEGRLSGFVSGLGAATADAIYGCIAGFGLTFVSDVLVGHQTWLRLVGGLFLLYLGVKTFLAQPSESPASTEGSGLIGAYGSILVLTLTNPLTILSFAAVFAGLGIAETDGNYASASLLVLGVFVGSGLWWLVLSTVAGAFRSRFSANALRWVNRIAGIIIAGFGLVALLSLIPAQRNRNDPQVRASFVGLAREATGFARAAGPRSFDFPADYGPHPEYHLVRQHLVRRASSPRAAVLTDTRDQWRTGHSDPRSIRRQPMVFGLLGSACLVTEECATSATHPAFRPCALLSSRLPTCDEEPSQPAISCPPGTESPSLSHRYAQVFIRHVALNPK